MNEDYIIKAIEEYLQKCSVTLKQVRAAIEPTINELVGNNRLVKEILLDEIPRFYRDNYNRKWEKSLVYDSDMIGYENDGDESKVGISPEARRIGTHEGLFLSFHNHPDGSAEFSGDDFLFMAGYKTEYNVCVSKGTIAITKTRLKPSDMDTLRDIDNNLCGLYTLELIAGSNDNGLFEVRKDYGNGKITESEYQENLKKIISDSMDKNFEKNIKTYGNAFKNAGLDIEYYGIRV